MKKLTQVVLTTIVVLFVTACLGVDIGPTTGWMSLKIYPLVDDEPQDILFTYRASSTRNNETVKIQIWLENGIFATEQLVFQDTTKINIGITDISRVFYFDSELYSEGSNSLRFSAIIGRVTKSITINAFHKTKSVVRPQISGQEVYASPYNLIELKNGIINKKRDNYAFLGFASIFEEDFYHHLDISRLMIVSENPFTYSKATLRIKDDMGFYSRLNRGIAIGYREVPLLVKQVEGGYGFAYGTKLYVDPDTLLMSLSSRDGFVSTNTFFFPKEHYNSQREIEMSIMITNCGINEDSIIYDFNHYTNLRFIGDCRNSKYCISTHSGDDESTLEWETISL